MRREPKDILSAEIMLSAPTNQTVKNKCEDPTIDED